MKNTTGAIRHRLLGIVGFIALLGFMQTAEAQ